MSEPKPLFGKDETVVAKATVPTVKPSAQTPAPKPLNFSSIPPVQPASHTTPNPTALFASTRPNSIVESAVKEARAKFASLGMSLDSVERQIKQLIPLTITNVVSWGEPGVSQESELITKSASLIKMFSEMRGNEIVENALNSASQTHATGFFQKLRNSTSSVLAYKPNLVVLKSQMMSLLPQVDEYVDKIQKAHLRVSINLAALSSVCDAVGDIQDSSLSVAVDNRRRILSQCVMQCDLTEQQLKQAKTLMVEQLSRASQLLDVTIPAFESANATK